MMRTRLPDRRRNAIRDIAFGGQAFTVCVGYDAAGAPRRGRTRRPRPKHVAGQGGVLRR